MKERRRKEKVRRRREERRWTTVTVSRPSQFTDPHVPQRTPHYTFKLQLLMLILPAIWRISDWHP